MYHKLVFCFIFIFNLSISTGGREKAMQILDVGYLGTAEFVMWKLYTILVICQVFIRY